MGAPSRRILDEAGLAETLAALARSIAAGGLEQLAIIGIRRRGVPIAERLADAVADLAGTRPPTGALDITLYRDDLSLVADQPLVRRTEIGFPVDGLRVVLTDDVLFTGRTVRSAIEALFSLGRPARIELAALVDRGGRELPIEANHVGIATDVAPGETVRVHMREIDGDDLVEVVSIGAEAEA